jgi:hypothetical protein
MALHIILPNDFSKSNTQEIVAGHDYQGTSIRQQEELLLHIKVAHLMT